MANGTFTIQSKIENTQFKYENTDVIITGNSAKDIQNDTLQSIGGTAYVLNEQGEQGNYIGNFNGYMRDGEMRYSVSEMSRSASVKVWDAIDEIEAEVTNTNAGEAES